MKITTTWAVAMLATAATFASCTKEAPSGKPFIVKVADTKGQAISAVNSFKLVGIQGTDAPWISDYLFTKQQDAWISADHADLRWPGGSATHTFYGVSDNTAEVPDIIDGKFEYTVPESFANQKDLLVSKNEDHPDGETVLLNFKHALSSVRFKVGFDKASRFGDSDYHIKITRITLYHIATKGTFDFAGFDSNPWTVNPDDAEYRDIVIDLKEPVEFTPTPVSGYTLLDSRYIDSDAIGEIYVMPQKPTAWDTDGTEGHPLKDSYIGVTCQLYEYMGGQTFYDYYGLDEDSDEDEYDDAKELYIDDGGQLSTDNDDWLNDPMISVWIPTSDDYSMNVYLKSHLDYRNQEAAANGTSDNVEELFIPLTMANGFGFNKTNTLNIGIDKVKKSNGRDLFQEIQIIIPIEP